MKLFFSILIPLHLISTAALSQSNDLTKKYFDSLSKSRHALIGNSFDSFQSNDINGIAYSNKSLEGKITLINFWFKDCVPCIAEFNALNKLNSQFKTNNKFQIISFTFETSEDCKKVIKQYNIDFTIIPISESECYRLNYNNGFPVILIIDEQGKILFIDTGGPTNQKQVQEKFDILIIPKLAQLLNKTK
jgi:cytochrome oxidase Cu insertion factor (SCO1/SenC/PrrC family)